VLERREGIVIINKGAKKIAHELVVASRTKKTRRKKGESPKPRSWELFQLWLHCDSNWSLRLYLNSFVFFLARQRRILFDQ